ncbi:MAG: phage tail terminator protein [Rhodospirillaceae bacterium]
MAALVQARLKERVPDLKAVQLQLDLDRVAKQVNCPAVFVALLAEQGEGRGRSINDNRQTVEERVAVSLVLSSANDPSGSRVEAELNRLRKQSIHPALIGWQPSPERGAVFFGTGSLVDLGDGQVWWQDIFRVSEHRSYA